MKRFVIVFALCLMAASLSFSGIVMTRTAAVAQPAAPTQNVTGDWKIHVTGGKNFIVGDLHLSQVGSTLVGSGVAPGAAGVVQISGQLSGAKVSGKWRGPTGEVGWITLNFHGDSAFNGEWGYGGRGPAGDIVAQKIRSSSF